MSANPEDTIRFVAKSASEAAEIVRRRLGPEGRVISVEQVSGSGLKRFLSSPQLQIVAQRVAPPARPPADAPPARPSADASGEASGATIQAAAPGGNRCCAGVTRAGKRFGRAQPDRLWDPARSGRIYTEPDGTPGGGGTLAGDLCTSPESGAARGDRMDQSVSSADQARQRIRQDCFCRLCRHRKNHGAVQISRA